MQVVPFSQMLDRPLARPRFNAWLLSVFAGGGLLLATIGLYAVMAAYVGQRHREIALRMALGATPMRVRGLILREALWLAGSAPPSASAEPSSRRASSVAWCSGSVRWIRRP